ncbi:MAG: hypothetical protein RIR70_1086 [Pseudomonadota bacterium]|jgi:type II secretion system protein H
MTLTSAPGRFKQAAGFTLVEILVVMVIIALGSALMSLSLGDTSDSRLRANARALGTFFNRVADEAAVRGHTLRVTAAEGGLKLEDLNLSPNAKDAAPANPTLPELSARVVKLAINGTAMPLETPILFPPGGGGSFTLTLELEGERFEVSRDSLSRLSVRQADS